ncbi:MAG: lysophospholipid acyltransferase family protein [Candidatus Marinimicrobia bacterium]|nr:lysophospholipid acyltransferase family protein [Candidatus Neomarinimicrobiota bacterium]
MNILLHIISLKFRILPRAVALFFGRCLGVFIYYFVPLRQNVATQNIKIAFPEYSPSTVKRLLKNTCKHYGMVLIDFLRQPNLDVKNITNFVQMDDETKHVLDKHDGGIIMTGHLGNWEAFLPALGLNGYPFVVVTQTQKSAGSQKFFNGIRDFPNISLIPRTGSRKKMLTVLEEKMFLGLASDQNAGKRGVKIPFFNEPASIPKGAALFHLKTGMPIIVGFCILSKGLKYNLRLREINLSSIPSEKEDAIIEINTQFSALLEKEVREYPEQYFWFHRKWKKSTYNTINK